MSEGRDILAAVIAERTIVLGDMVTNLRTGMRYDAHLDAVKDIESHMLLGRDARESVLFHFSRADAANIWMGDRLVALNAEFEVLSRSDNPVFTYVEFGAMKVTDKDV